ncbi:hypothetical protein KCP75_02315 [Salmonella enterica subsp. enterica]|nr:hypothetical protein KCP75_02315 [Salmonella enterica subsp. enterica]
MGRDPVLSIIAQHGRTISTMVVPHRAWKPANRRAAIFEVALLPFFPEVDVCQWAGTGVFLRNLLRQYHLSRLAMEWFSGSP